MTWNKNGHKYNHTPEKKEQYEFCLRATEREINVIKGALATKLTKKSKHDFFV